jgi:hypothetical protein
VAAKVKCPLHGDRFKPPFLIYVSNLAGYKIEPNRCDTWAGPGARPVAGRAR